MPDEFKKAFTTSSGSHVSLRLLLSVAMISLVTVVAAALIGLGYNRARTVALENVEQRMTAFSDRLVNRLVILSGDTSTLVGMIASAANSFLAPPTERLDDKITALREALLRSPHIDGVYAGYPDGSFFHAVNLSSPAWRAALKAPPEAALAIRAIERGQGGKALLQLIFIDAGGRHVGGRRDTPTSFDPRARTWYRMAAGGQDPITTGPYQMATTGALGMTISQSHNGHRRVVIGADVALTRITDFLSRELLTKSSIAFITDIQGRPIVHSAPRVMTHILTAMSERDFDSTLSPDSLVENLKSFSAEDGKVAAVMAGGRTYLVMATQVRSASLFQHSRVVIAAPYDELMAPANRALAQGVAIAIIVVSLGIATALLLSGLISRSLHKLTNSANSLQDLDFQTPISAASRISEISTLSQAMSRARDAIFTFALYVPRELVRKAILSGDFASRSATRQDVTAIFTDIYDFTTISEQYPPEEVVGMLSVYFDILSRTVSAHHGTLIQFLGDSIFAMWNAPLIDEKHVEHACLAALAMQQALEEFNADQRQKGLPEFKTRFGVHTGTAVVGSAGAADRLQYTAVGDTINVASRLEGMNKIYGTTILASADVEARCRDTIRFRPLGEGRAKGKAIAVELFEVLGVTKATGTLARTH